MSLFIPEMMAMCRVLGLSQVGTLAQILRRITTFLYEDVEVSFLHNVEVVALISLLNHIFTFGNLFDEHCI